jgi:hypothetical protein
VEDCSLDYSQDYQTRNKERQSLCQRLSEISQNDKLLESWLTSSKPVDRKHWGSSLELQLQSLIKDKLSKLSDSAQKFGQTTHLVAQEDVLLSSPGFQ